MIKLFEYFKPEMEFNNDLKKHLEQFPFLRYSFREINKEIFITFSGDVSYKYIKGIIAPYTIDMVEEKPLKVKVTGKKSIADFEEFKGKGIIGNVERINIPSMEIKNVLVKVDSGATASSIHCDFIEIDGKNVKFTPLDSSYEQYKKKVYTAPIEDMVEVQNSSGDKEKRPMVKFVIEIKGKKLETYFSLANREELEYPILLGKDIVSGNFLIDPSLMNENKKRLL